MRRVAIMSKRRFADLPYVDWLKSGNELLLFAHEKDEAARAAACSPSSGFTRAHLLPDWSDANAIEDALVTEHRREPFDALVALSESDLIRAARFRELLGISGQTLGSATAFRDKRVMKDLARSAGLQVPAFAAVSSAQELIEFAAEIRRPVIVKPLAGGGTYGVTLIDNLDGLESAAHRLFQAGPAECIAEEYIDAPMIVVDGVMWNGVVVDSSAGTYTLDCYSSLSRCLPMGLLQLAREDPRAVAACAYVDRLVAALPSASLTTAFHCELFDCTSVGPMLCEIASRTGGCRINDMYRHSRGIDLAQWSALGQAGVDPTGTVSSPIRAGALMGCAIFPPPGGVLMTTPMTPAPRSVIEHGLYARRGEHTPRWRKISEYAVDVLFAADSRAALETAYEDTLAWVGAGVVWDQAGSTRPEELSTAVG